MSTYWFEETPLRVRVRDILAGHGKLGRLSDFITFGATLLAVTVFAVETVPQFYDSYEPLFHATEVLLSIMFLVEYLGRIWSSEKPLSYIFSFWGAVDLASTAPALVFLGPDVAFARGLRLFRLARILKFFRIKHAQERLLEAIRVVAPDLAVFLGFTIVLLFFASAGIYHFEHDAQPEVFKSIPHSMWWAVVTFTTVGYGDIVPVTTGGRIFTGILLILGLSIVAIPTGLFSSALSETRRERKKRRRAQRLAEQAKIDQQTD